MKTGQAIYARTHWLLGVSIPEEYGAPSLTRGIGWLPVNKIMSRYIVIVCQLLKY